MLWTVCCWGLWFGPLLLCRRGVAFVPRCVRGACAMVQTPVSCVKPTFRGEKHRPSRAVVVLLSSRPQMPDSDPLDKVAEMVSRECRLLCLDEMQARRAPQLIHR